MTKKAPYMYRTGDRVDFCYPGGEPQRTPGTIISRVNGGPDHSYQVRWDDGNADNEVYSETDLVKVTAAS